MLGGTGRDETGFQRGTRPLQETEPRKEGKHRRHHVSDAGEVLQQSGGAHPGTNRAAGL